MQQRVHVYANFNTAEEISSHAACTQVYTYMQTRIEAEYDSVINEY
jgi:hypothetical protein